MFQLRLPEEVNMTNDMDAGAEAIQKTKESVNDFAKKIGLLLFRKKVANEKVRERVINYLSLFYYTCLLVFSLLPS